MGLFTKPQDTSPHTKEISNKGFEVSSCSFECDSCHLQFPSSVKVETSDTLWNSTSEFGLHIIIPTNQTDWTHDAFEDPETFNHKFKKFIDKCQFKNLPNSTIKMSVSSQTTQGFSDCDPDYVNSTMGDILILPQFVWIRNIHETRLDSVLQNALQQIIDEIPLDSIMAQTNPQFTIEQDLNHSYLLMCSHRTRDKRCGITAPIMKKEIDIYTRELGLYRDYGDNRPGGIQVAFVNHVGGHKYSANVIIYIKQLKKNIWLARCSPINVKSIIDECVLKGNVFPDNTRLIQNFSKDW